MLRNKNLVLSHLAIKILALRGIRFLVLCTPLLLQTIQRCNAQTVDFQISNHGNCAPQSITFTDLSSGGGGVASISWHTDTGNPDVQGQAVLTNINYLEAKTYHVTLTVTFRNGTTDSKTKDIILHANPTPDFIADKTVICAGDAIHFIDKSTDAGGTITNWLWNLDINTVTVQSPVQIFSLADTGFHNITLSVSNNWGCNAQLPKPRYINVVNKPVANFGAPFLSTCNDSLTVFISNTSNNASSFLWDFGDTIGTSTLVNPSHTYLHPGSYDIVLSAQAAIGCSDQKKVTVNIGRPAVKITAFSDTVCQGVASNFAGTVSPSSVTGKWFFADKGQTFTRNSVSYIFANPGDYEVIFSATNTWNCTSIPEKRMVHVIANPIPFFTPFPKSTCNNTLTVTCTSNNAIGAEYWWDFGDGDTSHALNPTHFYKSEGSYKLTLHQIAGQRCENTYFETITVGGTQAKITSFPDTLCENDNVKNIFSGQTTPPADFGKWFFGDKNQMLNGKSVRYIFTATGTYDVYFIAYNAAGCADTAKKKIFIAPLPKPRFSIDAVNSCQVPFTVQTTNNTPGDHNLYSWDFGDGGTSNEFAPSHQYTRFGNFTITLTVKDTSISAGCSLSSSQLVRITAPVAAITYSPAVPCGQLATVNFTAKPGGFDNSPLQYFWSFGDGADSITTVPNVRILTQHQKIILSQLKFLPYWDAVLPLR